MNSLQIFPVLIATIVAFLCGAIWYSPMLFGKTRVQALNFASKAATRHTFITYLLAFVLFFIAASVFSLFLGIDVPLSAAVFDGFITGICWVATSFGINYLFIGRSIKLFLIDAGFHTLQFTLYGVVFGLWQ